MLSKDLDEFFTVTEQVVIFNNHIEKIYPGQTVEEVIQFTWGKPKRGEVYQVANMTETRQVTLLTPGGCDRLSTKAFRRVGQPVIEVTSVLKWNGKKFI